MATATMPITGDPAADEFLVTDPLALVIGMLLDQQVPMEWAFRGPSTLRDRLGGLDAAEIAAMPPEELEAVFREKPALHRYPGSMAKRTHALCVHLVEQYDGDAAKIWTGVDDPAGAVRPASGRSPATARRRPRSSSPSSASGCRSHRRAGRRTQCRSPTPTRARSPTSTRPRTSQRVAGLEAGPEGEGQVEGPVARPLGAPRPQRVGANDDCRWRRTAAQSSSAGSRSHASFTSVASDGHLPRRRTRLDHAFGQRPPVVLRAPGRPSSTSRDDRRGRCVVEHAAVEPGHHRERDPDPARRGRAHRRCRAGGRRPGARPATRH